MHIHACIYASLLNEVDSVNATPYPLPPQLVTKIDVRKQRTTTHKKYVDNTHAAELIENTFIII